MKRAAIALTAAMMSLPVFAADDLCEINLQKIDDTMTTNPTLGQPLQGQVEELQQKAMSAKAAGKTEDCIAASGQALQLLRTPGNGGTGGGGGTSGN